MSETKNEVYFLHGDTSRWTKMHAGSVEWRGGVMKSASALCGQVADWIPEEKVNDLSQVTCGKCRQAIERNA